MMKIFLRALEPDDYQVTFKWRSDKKISNMIAGNKFFISKEREKLWVEAKSINDKDGIYLAICLKENQQMIGYCSIINIDLKNLKAELGGTIIGEKEQWGKGMEQKHKSYCLNTAFWKCQLIKYMDML
ncbi:MAG: GNAT family N-acetyltransferase [Candidatus Marinimicrobia bacterium]|nr:GNAT family N-acetyltransferase [Candidatus Neomarinimicrobiota bacterium]